MNTSLRALVSLLIVLWLGAVLFFLVVAGVAFKALPDAHAAGLVVRNCLHTLHIEGLIAGAILLFALFAAGRTHAYGRTVIGPILCAGAMLLLTAFSQWSIMPRIETDRLAVGGDIDRAPANAPPRLEFNRLHAASEWVEGGVVLAGVVMVVLLARPPKSTIRVYPTAQS